MLLSLSLSRNRKGGGCDEPALDWLGLIYTQRPTDTSLVAENVTAIASQSESAKNRERGRERE